MMTGRKDGSIHVVISAEIEEIVPFFFEKRRNDVAALESALSNGDFATAGRLGHQIKGSGGSYGFDEISRLGAIIETAAQKRDAATAGTALSDLANYLDRVVVSYEDFQEE